jgi:hypothetical protein
MGQGILKEVQGLWALVSPRSSLKGLHGLDQATAEKKGLLWIELGEHSRQRAHV